ncbi:MAG TPA: hypothetical protein EYO58_04730 [Flavobacteriales bacterium]|nr:hypothetical protein [Flavobacteriales bacterium]HIO15377.1 hypothetical protein [Flavobacteriales bacterium]
MKITIFSGLFIASLSILILTSCSDDAKVVDAVSNSESSAVSSASTGIFSGKSLDSSKRKSYKVSILEIRQASKYSYLKVEGEGDGLSEGNPYWIATLRGDFQVGDEYVYTGRLLKSKFQSKELGEVFDMIYLVSFIEEISGGSPIVATVEGVVSISDVVTDPMKYAGTIVRVHGQITKVNESIMDRNWIHLKDGTADDYDFVLTSKVSVPVGHSVTFEGLITTDKDFGAGYIYELIMEDAAPIQ